MYLKRTRLEFYMKHKKINQTELAKLLGVTKAMMSNLLNQKRKVSFEILDKLMQIFGREEILLYCITSSLFEIDSFGNFIPTNYYEEQNYGKRIKS